MGLKEQLRRVEKAAQGHLESFPLQGGGRYAYDPTEAGISMFLYTCALIRSPYHPDWPEPEEPEILGAIRNAKDPDEVLARFESGDMSRAFVDPRLLVYGPAPEPEEIEDLSD
jgi:hypothetical protein